MDLVTALVFTAVLAARFLVPFAIFKYPLPAIVACLVLDGYDQTIFQLLGQDPPGYQTYDKAMDIWYLAIAYLSMLRNWDSAAAFRVGWFLYFYRLVGVVVFEVTHARWVLLVFPNTFEYFFIVYELIRLRWRPSRIGARFWLGVAVTLWVVVKLPQEWWLHVAQMDMSDTLAAHRWVYGVLAGLVLAAGAVCWAVQRRVLGPPEHRVAWVAPAIPPRIDTALARAAWISSYDAIRSVATVEKVVLVGMVSVVYSTVLPDYRGSALGLFYGVGVVVVVNTAFSIVTAHRRWTVTGAFASIVARLAFNVVFVTVADWILNKNRDDLHGFDTMFFLTLISLITTLHDRYRPVHSTRMRALDPEPQTRVRATAEPR